jgi:hypothetical protein
LRRRSRGLRERHGRRDVRFTTTACPPFRGSAVTSHQRDCAGRPKHIAEAGEACASTGFILSPPQSAHRGSSHHTAAQPALNDTARRNPASVFGTCLPRRGRPFTHQVARRGSAVQSQTRSRGLRLHPAEGMPRRRHLDVGESGLSGRWSLLVPSPAPSHRLTKREATRAAFSTTSVRTPRWPGPTPWRVVFLPLVLPQHSFLIVQDIAGAVDGSYRPGIVRRLPSYYDVIRLLRPIHRQLRLLAFPPSRR